MAAFSVRTSAGVICVTLGTDSGSSGSSGRCGSKRMPGASAHDASNGTIPRHTTALPNLKLLESFSTLDDSLVCKKTRMARRHRCRNAQRRLRWFGIGARRVPVRLSARLRI
ncbi:hypothetical protein CT19431_80244 [Cupriavidus taiwanensis]|nr:hypothetical protein CT19431_80244 [Cupriavidus taiwanensis]